MAALAAAKAGAAQVTAAEIDPNEVAALRLNAALNGEEIGVGVEDLTGGDPPKLEVVLVGDCSTHPSWRRGSRRSWTAARRQASRSWSAIRGAGPCPASG